MKPSTIAFVSLLSSCALQDIVVTAQIANAPIKRARDTTPTANANFPNPNRAGTARMLKKSRRKTTRRNLQGAVVVASMSMQEDIMSVSFMESAETEFGRVASSTEPGLSLSMSMSPESIEAPSEAASDEVELLVPIVIEEAIETSHPAGSPSASPSSKPTSSPSAKPTVTSSPTAKAGKEPAPQDDDEEEPLASIEMMESSNTAESTGKPPKSAKQPKKKDDGAKQIKPHDVTSDILSEDLTELTQTSFLEDGSDTTGGTDAPSGALLTSKGGKSRRRRIQREDGKPRRMTTTRRQRAEDASREDASSMSMAAASLVQTGFEWTGENSMSVMTTEETSAIIAEGAATTSTEATESTTTTTTTTTKASKEDRVEAVVTHDLITQEMMLLDSSPSSTQSPTAKAAKEQHHGNSRDAGGDDGMVTEQTSFLLDGNEPEHESPPKSKGSKTGRRTHDAKPRRTTRRNQRARLLQAEGRSMSMSMAALGDPFWVETSPTEIAETATTTTTEATTAITTKASKDDSRRQRARVLQEAEGSMSMNNANLTPAKFEWSENSMPMTEEDASSAIADPLWDGTETSPTEKIAEAATSDTEATMTVTTTKASENPVAYVAVTSDSITQNTAFLNTADSGNITPSNSPTTKASKARRYK